MRRVCKRWREIYPITENLVYENELGKSRIDKLAEQYAEELAANYDEKQAWSITQKYSDYEYDGYFSNHQEAVEHLRDWLICRIDWLDAQFAQME